MSKHSPSPWFRDKKNPWDIRDARGATICKMYPWDVSGCREDDQADANLVAAAPLLYEAMQKAVDEEGIDDLGQLSIGTSNTAAILTALKIARGEE